MEHPDAVAVRGNPQQPSTPAVEGLATGAFLAMRGKEECYRAQRYRRPLTLVVINLPQPDPATEARLQNFLHSGTRASDIGACLARDTYALLLPETDGRSAAALVQRLLVEAPRVRAASASVPDDGLTWDEIFHKASRNR